MIFEKEFIVNFLFFNAVLNPNMPKAFQLPLIFFGVVVKLRELSIGYTLPKIWFRNTPITNVKVSIVGRDLFNIYKAAPVNAEFAQNSQDVFQAFELAALPSTRTVGFSLNVKF